VNRSTLYANMLSMSFHTISSASLVKWIIKEEGLYVNSPMVIPLFKCNEVENYWNGLNDGPELQTQANG
jgi:hypothetical protein